jgi:putative protein kinase ArgK-like GTPase of G3E family
MSLQHHAEATSEGAQRALLRDLVVCRRGVLAENLPEILATLETLGFDEVLLETVGAGQADYGVRAAAGNASRADVLLA